MSWFTINGISVSRVASAASPPAGARRDIGQQGDAADGSLVLTRQARKRDLKLSTRPLSGADAFAWEGLFVGDGHVWSFDSSMYSSKGLGPTTFDGALASTSPAPKYGAKYTRLTIDQQLTYTLGYTTWTAAFWAYDSGTSTWRHYVERSDGKKWIDGRRDDSFAVDPFVLFGVSGGVFEFQGPDPGPANVDDLIVVPYLWPLDWPAQVFAAGTAFGGTPYLTAAGDMVPEAATRRMLCRSVSEKVLIANLGAGLKRDTRTLDVELAGA